MTPVRYKRFLAAAALALAVGLGEMHAGRAADGDDELRAAVQANARRIAALEAQVSRQGPLDDDTVRKIAAAYLREDPGAGLPAGVQAGYYTDAGFVLRSAPNPAYTRWDDESPIPFELRTRVRINATYVFYKSIDDVNHLTGQRLPGVPPDLSQLMVKRATLIEDGTAFDPDLHFRIAVHGDTRGLPTIVGGGPFVSGAATPSSGAIAGDAVRTAEVWLSYDFHGAERPIGADGAAYRPTFTLTAGKRKSFFGLEEYLGNANEQFVEYSMADLLFDADDDNLSVEAGFQVKASEDRFYLEAVATNGSQSLAPNVLMDDLPGFIAGCWYDFGGSWNLDKKGWDLFGGSISDLDYSRRPVVRAGGSMNLVPMDRRSLYGDAEQGRFFVTPGAPGGSKLINVLDGDVFTPAAGFPSPHAVDAFDAYSFNAFVAGKYRGFSLLNEWWLRDLTHFRAPPAGGGVILYQDSLGPGGAAANALFPAGANLIDYGSDLQAGWFIVPRKLEIAARWSWVRGQSGNINGDGAYTTAAVPGTAAPVHVVRGAFRGFHEADEYTIGLNYYFYRQQVKWQTDLGLYRGGNPANEGVTYPGFLTGVDGYMVRTQLSLFF